MKRAHTELDDNVADICVGAEDSSAAPSAEPSSVPVEQPQLAYCNLWYYDDVQGMQQGPFSSFEMRSWFAGGYMQTDTRVAPSWYGEVPSMTWPIHELWADPGAQAFVLAADAQVVATEPPKPEFIPSDTFDGCRDGYVFKTEEYGTGYYRDELQPVEITFDELKKEIEDKKARYSNFVSATRPPSSPSRR